MNTSKVNRFFEPIMNKKKKFDIIGYFKLKKMIRQLKKTSPDFNMLMEIYEFLLMLEQVYLYGKSNTTKHCLFGATVPKNFDGAIIFDNGEFVIKYLLSKNNKRIAIEGSKNSGRSVFKYDFYDGENIIENDIDEQRFLLIISCLMDSLCDLIVYYYKNKRF